MNTDHLQSQFSDFINPSHTQIQFSDLLISVPYSSHDNKDNKDNNNTLTQSYSGQAAAVMTSAPQASFHYYNAQQMSMQSSSYHLPLQSPIPILLTPMQPSSIYQQTLQIPVQTNSPTPMQPS